MEYVRFGSTGLKVSRICLGCMSYVEHLAWTTNLFRRDHRNTPATYGVETSNLPHEWEKLSNLSFASNN